LGGGMFHLDPGGKGPASQAIWGSCISQKGSSGYTAIIKERGFTQTSCKRSLSAGERGTGCDGYSKKCDQGGPKEKGKLLAYILPLKGRGPFIKGTEGLQLTPEVGRTMVRVYSGIQLI